MNKGIKRFTLTVDMESGAQLYITRDMHDEGDIFGFTGDGLQPMPLDTLDDLKAAFNAAAKILDPDMYRMTRIYAAEQEVMSG